jgi:hypothetical protein
MAERDIDYLQLVKEDRIHTSVYTSPGIFDD